MTETTPGRLLLAGLKALVAALVATLTVYVVATAVFEIPPEFPPLAGPGPTIFFTTVGAVGAAVVYAALVRFAERPRYLFRRVAVLVLLISFIPDLWLLGEGASASFPGATPTGAFALMLMHVVAAGAIVWVLTGRRA